MQKKMGAKSVIWHDREIILDQVYYVHFPDEPRDMPQEKIDSYNRIRTLPEKLMWKMILEMDPADNPNVLPMIGIDLLEKAETGNFLPQFDKDWEKTRRLTLMPAQGLEFFLENSTII